jgi:protein TonB
MFETSVVKAGAIAAPHRGGVLTVSIVFHSFVAAAAVAMSIQSGSFPPEAPRQMALFMPVAPLPPLPRGNPDAPRNPAPKPQAAQPQQHQQTAPPQQQQDVTPNTIPNNVPQVSGSDTPGPNTGTGNSSEPWGVKDGDPNGVDIGQPAMPQVPTAAPAGPLMPVGEVHAARVLSRVDPKYPNIALAHRIGGVVKVHCIIDKNGNLSAPEIVSSSFPPFNQSVIEALQRWTFAPGTLHGNPVDTYFELTITFAPR